MNYRQCGERIDLKPLSFDELRGNYVSWLNDQAVCAFSRHGGETYTVEKARAWIAALEGDATREVWAIYLAGGSLHIGNISLQQIDHINRNAEIAILLGEKSEWGKGYGTEAVAMMLQRGFGELRLHRIFSGVRVDNLAMRRVFEKTGFSQEGILRESVYKNGQFHDVAIYGIISAPVCVGG